jgi:hypothetical protein
VQRLDESESFALYPNPCRDIIHIAGSGASICNYSITDMFGRLLEHNRSVSLPAQLSLQHLPAGLYQVVIESQGSSHVYPFVKQAD